MTAATTWRHVFEQTLPTHAWKAAAPLVEELLREVGRAAPPGQTDGLVAVLRARLAALQDVREQGLAARQALAAGRRIDQERVAVLELLGAVPGPGSAAGDRRAARRWLDGEALEDRMLRREHDVRQAVELLARVVGHQELTDGPATSAVVQGLLERAVDPDEPWTLREACLSALAAAVPVAPRVLPVLESLATDASLDPWVQAAALEAWSRSHSDQAVSRMIVRCLSLDGTTRIRHRDHAFFRARAVHLAGRRKAWDLVWDALSPEETSAHVQLAAVRALARSAEPLQHRRLVLIIRDTDRSLAVRAGAALGTLDPEARARAALVVVRAALAVGGEVAAVVLDGLAGRVGSTLPPEGLARARAEVWGPALDTWARDPKASADTRVDAAAVRLALHVAVDPALRSAWSEVRAFASTAREGDRTVVHADLDEDAMLDVLSLVARDSMDLSARPKGKGRWVVFLGPRRRKALWRALYELTHPRPDKRQGFDHTLDEMPAASLLAPSGRVAEVTPTAVPGRPVSAPEQRWWSPDVPLPAWAIAAGRRGRLRVRALPDVDLTLEGGAVPPVTWLRSQLRYARLARVRAEAVELGGTRGRQRMDEALDRVGVRVTRAEAPRPDTARTTAWAVPALSFPTLDQLLALDGTTLSQLALFSGVLGLGWLTSATVRQAHVRRSRSRIPLVIGGWGSRGKSGTERLKAALFQELGYITVSKTTGNEAMVVVGVPGREAVELFLYRPYERASIVEQRAVLHMAAGMGAQVLLWECMALNPRYVEILQHDWMRDDYTTVTNTYPDHEDVQGPTGHDVAVTIGKVLPRGARALTTEQAMGPILAERARRLGSALEIVRPEAWRLIPEDVISRFPYAEHPRNIALVTRLAQALGVPEDVAWRAMADRLVPDLGVLTEYGPIQLGGRTVSYVVGNSANERAGFLSSWRRMRFDALPDGAGLTDAQVLIVNNRKDRLPRQEVFARVAALDAPADALVIIGTNVGPFLDQWRGFVRGELRNRLLDLVDDRQRLAVALARTLRRAVLTRDGAEAVLGSHDPTITQAEARERVDEAWAAASPDAPPPVPAGPVDAETWLRQVAWLASVSQRADAQAGRAAVEAVLAHVEARGVGVRDAYATGDRVTRLAISRCPAGARVRLLGAANIKGTGMGLVRRWLQVEQVLTALGALPAGGIPAREAVALLRTLPLGPVDGGVAVGGLKALVGGDAIDDPDLRAELKTLTNDLRARLRSLDADGEKGAGVGSTVRSLAANVDLGSLTRRQRADLLMRDLAKQRVGLRRAAAVARELTERQRK